MFGANDTIYELTQENNRLLAQVVELERQLAALRQEAKDTAENLCPQDNGRLDALKYVDHCISMQLGMFKDLRTVGYKQALLDLQVSVRASMERLITGGPMKVLTPLD